MDRKTALRLVYDQHIQRKKIQQLLDTYSDEELITMGENPEKMRHWLRTGNE